MIDLRVLHVILGVLTGWLDRREREAIAYLIEENRLLRHQLGGRRLRLTEDDRRRLTARAYRVGRAALGEIATIATPDTLLRWHRQLIARKWTYAAGPGRRAVLLEIRQLIVRMATDNPTWGYTRIQGGSENQRPRRRDLSDVRQRIAGHSVVLARLRDETDRDSVHSNPCCRWMN